MWPRHPEHLKTFDYLGAYRYALCFCRHQRSVRFETDDRVTLTWDQILRAASEQSFAVIVSCFMPDHLHLLVEGLT